VKGNDDIISVKPRLLKEGVHFVDSYLFQYERMVDVSDEYIHHGSIHRVEVDKGMVGKCWHDNLPRLLGEGDHTIESTQFSFKGTESIMSNPCIVHGTITILRGKFTGVICICLFRPLAPHFLRLHSDVGSNCASLGG
jgi:hypothetical protein